MTGWLVNDYLTCIPRVKTFWHFLLKWFPDLQDKTGIDYSNLPRYIETQFNNTKNKPNISNPLVFSTKSLCSHFRLLHLKKN